MNKEDFLGIENTDLGILKYAFLGPQRERECILYTDILTTKEISIYMRKISKYSKEERLKIITEKINKIYTGYFTNEEELNKEIAYLVILLKSIPFEKDEADIYWKNREESCVHKDTDNVLIEVAAMHPLIQGKPGKEFQEHLDQAIELYNIEKLKGKNPIIYVPGSLHYIKNKKTNTSEVDDKPLSEAGKQYLISHGIPSESIRANEVNLIIKKEDGVYNSGDECYVAAQIAQAENCGRIISVVSPVQLYRKALFYLEFGYTPEMYATGTEKTNHNYIGELFWSLYITYMNDQDWQIGFLSYLTRKERNIEYPEKIKDYSEIVQDIIDNGPGIPERVFKQREKWMALYNKAKENMEIFNESKHGILINLIRTDRMHDLEQKRLLDIVEQYPNCKITIVHDAAENIEDIIKIMKNKSNNLKFLSLENTDPYLISELFKNGDFRKIFAVYPSSVCTKKSVEFIKQGVIPIVSTLPDTNPNYINNISLLLDEVMRPFVKIESER